MLFLSETACREQVWSLQGAISFPYWTVEACHRVLVCRHPKKQERKRTVLRHSHPRLDVINVIPGEIASWISLCGEIIRPNTDFGGFRAASYREWRFFTNFKRNAKFNSKLASAGGGGGEDGATAISRGRASYQTAGTWGSTEGCRHLRSVVHF